MTTVFLVAAGTWIGALLFQSAVVAPSVFSSLDDANAGALLRRLFPRLFRLGLVCGLAMAGSAAAMAAADAWSPTLRFLTAIGLAVILVQAVSMWLVPKINAARDLGIAGAARFATLHRLSVLLSLSALGLALAGMATVASRAGQLGGLA